MATGCLRQQSISGTVRNIIGQPRVLEFRHDNLFDRSNRFIYSFSFDVTLLNTSTDVAGESISSFISEAFVLPVFQIDDVTSFSVSVSDTTNNRIILENRVYYSATVFENTVYFEFDRPLQVGPGVYTVSLELMDYKWPDGIDTADGSGYLNFLSCMNAPNCDEFIESWRNLAIEHEYFRCPKVYTDKFRAYLQSCHNDELPSRGSVQTAKKCIPH